MQTQHLLAGLARRGRRGSHSGKAGTDRRPHPQGRPPPVRAAREHRAPHTPGFSAEATSALETATHLAWANGRDLRRQFVGTEHLLAALTFDTGSRRRRVLNELNKDAAADIEREARLLPRPEPTRKAPPSLQVPKRRDVLILRPDGYPEVGRLVRRFRRVDLLRLRHPRHRDPWRTTVNPPIFMPNGSEGVPSSVVDLGGAALANPDPAPPPSDGVDAALFGWMGGSGQPRSPTSQASAAALVPELGAGLELSPDAERLRHPATPTAGCHAPPAAPDQHPRYQDNHAPHPQPRHPLSMEHHRCSSVIIHEPSVTHHPSGWQLTTLGPQTTLPQLHASVVGHAASR